MPQILPNPVLVDSDIQIQPTNPCLEVALPPSAPQDLHIQSGLPADQADYNAAVGMAANRLTALDRSLAQAPNIVGHTSDGLAVSVGPNGTLVPFVADQPNRNGNQYTREAMERMVEQMRASSSTMVVGGQLSQSTLNQVGNTLRELQQSQSPVGTIIHVDSVSQQGDRVNVDMSIRPPPAVERIVIQTRLNQPAAVPHCIICGSWDCDHLRPVRQADPPLEVSAFEQPKCQCCGERRCTGLLAGCQVGQRCRLCGLQDCAGDCPHEARNGAYGYPGAVTSRYVGSDPGADSTHIYRRTNDGGLDPIRPDPALVGPSRLMEQIIAQSAVRRARANERSEPGTGTAVRTDWELRAYYEQAFQNVQLPQMMAQHAEAIREAADARYGGAYQQIRFETEGRLPSLPEPGRVSIDETSFAYGEAPNVESAEVAGLRRAAEQIAADPELSRAFIGEVHRNIADVPDSVREAGLRNGFDPMHPIP